MARSLTSLGEMALAAHASQERARLDRLLEATRRRLGGLRFNRMWDQGRCISIDDAIALAKQLAAVPQALHQESAPATGRSVLSNRESQFVQLVARGLTNRQIAASLVIAERTAEHHVENIMAKLGLSSRTQVGVWAAEHKLDPGLGLLAASHWGQSQHLCQEMQSMQA